MKWNLIDRVGTQVLYAVTGFVLAAVLPRVDFGIVGAALVFQAFASLLVDSGFSYALIQRKNPTHLDYSTVLWFNIALAVILYGVLYVSAPWIADIFQGDQRLIPISRVLFLAIILNASAIVQTNRLMKRMDVRMVAVSNSIGLAIGGIVGITLALTGFGAWAIVWQTLTTAAAKSLILWTTSHWRPLLQFSWASLKSYFGIGSKMMFTSFLNTLFLNIYSIFIGHFVNLGVLADYTQADKWSKMGVTSITQMLTSSFLPALSAMQDAAERFAAMVSKMNRFTSYVAFPFLVGLMLMATPIFHALFGTKWDQAIILFQLLLFRGIFVVFTSLYNNYILALGHGGSIVRLEIIRDSAAAIALAVTFPFMTLSTPESPVYGIEIMLWGQITAAVITWLITLIVAARRTGISAMRFIVDMLPYLAQTIVIVPIMYIAAQAFESPWLQLGVETIIGISLYLIGNTIFGSKIQKDVFAYFRGRKLT